MTRRPRLRTGNGLLPGLLAVALFAVTAAIVLNTSFGEMAGFPEGVTITAAIGYAMFDFASLQAESGIPGTEPFLISFILIAVLLDAALDASLVLAKREEEGETVAPLASVTRSDEAALAVSGTAADGGSREADRTPEDESEQSGGDGT